MASVLNARGTLLRRLPSAGLLALGLAGLYSASSLSFGSVREPGSGFYPTLVCAALVVFAAISLAEGSSPFEDQAEPRAHLRVWLVVAALGAYAWALASLGFVVCTAVLLVFLLRGIGRVSWIASTLAAVIGSVGSYALFVQLGLPLPAGVLAF